MNIKKAAGFFMRTVVAIALLWSALLLLPGTPAITAHAKECDHGAYSWVTMVNPTCSKNGKKVKICQECEKELETEIIEKTEHLGKWEVTQEPTCSAKGTKAFICRNCQEILETEEVQTKKHTFIWTVTKAATCKDKGTKQQVCQNCGATGQIKTIQKTGHKYKWETSTAAACDRKGISSHKCQNCGYVNETKNVPSKGHKKGRWSIKSIVPDGKSIKVTQVRTCKTCLKDLQIATGSSAMFPQKHDKNKYFYKHTPGSGKIVILCTECHQSVTGTVSGTKIRFTRPKKDNSKHTTKAWTSMKN